MGPKSNNWCLYKERAILRHTETQEARRPDEDRGRDWSYAATSQGAREPPGAEEARKDSLLGPSEVHGPASFLISEFCLQNYERINAYCFKPPSLWYAATAAVETITGRKTAFSFRRN